VNFIALKMLFGDRAKYIGIVIGLTFASFLVTWPSAIFSGVMSRTFSFVTDIGRHAPRCHVDDWLRPRFHRQHYLEQNSSHLTT
jgi:hypothetical protein